MKTLLLYTSREGQTQKIMARIHDILIQDNDLNGSIDLIELKQNTQIDLSIYSTVIIGTSIRYGFYPKLIKQFINEHTKELNEKLSGFFGVNMVARKPLKNTPETNIYTKKFLSSINWTPKFSAVFAGALYYPKYNWFDRNMIRFIMWLGKGDTDVTKPMIEYTDWEKVAEFAQLIRLKIKKSLSH